ncbi:deoxyribose-phosphate aldolase [Knoellia sp. CPCC 206453]|uniref:deoxyribose-phosphate aldolase n=1 Tax=Knoellia pratensis TaxID=3404796 RepID=UPI00361DDBC2
MSTTKTAVDAELDAAARARELLGVSRLTNQSLTRWLHGLPGVDQVGCEARAADLGTRSIKTTSKAWAIDLAISMIDLTTLEGADTRGRVRGLAAKALVPDPSDLSTPRPAAVCVYGDMVETAKEVLGNSGVKVAAVATAFPSGRASLPVKLADTKDAVRAGADEIDMVIDRGAFLSGDYLTVFNQIVEVTKVCERGDGTRARLKVIMETGELNTYDNVRRASWLSMLAGGDFIKTSTGKIQPAATLPVTLTMLEAVRDWRDLTGTQVGVKPAGGIKTSKDAIKFLVTVSEIAGDDWLDNHWFRFGASSLLNDLLLQRQRMTTGAYSGANYIADDSPSTAY